MTAIQKLLPCLGQAFLGAARIYIPREKRLPIYTYYWNEESRFVRLIHAKGLRETLTDEILIFSDNTLGKANWIACLVAMDRLNFQEAVERWHNASNSELHALSKSVLIYGIAKPKSPVLA